MRGHTKARRGWSRLGGLLLLVLGGLVLASAPSNAQYQGDCPGDIGCTTCRFLRPTPAGEDRPIWCDLHNYNGGCACFTWFVGSTEYCENYGSCIYTGWQGGPPPRV